MTLVWITGVPGAGKSTVRRELVRRGHPAYDADYDGFRLWRDRATEELVVDPGRERRPPDWHQENWFPLERARVEELRLRARTERVFLCGSVANELDVWDLFDLVVCLHVDDETLVHRLATRTDNDFGKTDEVRDAILGWNATARENYRRFGAVLIDATRTLDRVVDDVLAATAADSA